MAAKQPGWQIPKLQEPRPVLKLYNSLTRAKTEFIATGRVLKWYNCGPTVYDASHMGHARNYVTQDILRRIMTDYFGYNVHFVMNVTDIDDKIILRARQSHLVALLKRRNPTVTEELRSQVSEAWSAYFTDRLSKGLGSQPQEATWLDVTKRVSDPKEATWREDCLRRDEKFEMHVNTLKTARAALEASQVGQPSDDLFVGATGVLAEALDKTDGHSVTDPAIPRKLAAYWEERFMDDMSRLRVRSPDTLTRVTEYVPEIVSFVQKIIDNGFAYEDKGSVYFDTGIFDRTEDHDYAKLQPWSKGNRELLEEGEGSLATKTGRRSAADFALWKASKPGEPSWPSAWGPGRPGWHIECSVMASAIFGSGMDIHSGGIDLAFPHHDNELAQSEAYHNCPQWVNYFLHTGHLHINGLKMSKSLKNFITVDEILQRYTARQLRLSFLMQLWNNRMDFQYSVMDGEIRQIESTFDNFFANVIALSRQAGNAVPLDNTSHRNGVDELALMETLHSSQIAFHAALSDSFNTPEAMGILTKLVSSINIYIRSRTPQTINVETTKYVARWITQMLRMFGLGEGPAPDHGIGWGDAASSKAEGTSEATLMPYLEVLSSFRDGVRKLAIAKTDTSLKDILTLSDKLRDIDLIPLGVALDDQSDGKALVKLVPPEQLMRDRGIKRAAEEAQLSKRAANAAADQEKKRIKMEKGRVPPQEMFEPPHNTKWSRWDEKGLPTHDVEGNEISKSAKKNAVKEWEKQAKLHEEFLKWSQSGT